MGRLSEQGQTVIRRSPVGVALLALLCAVFVGVGIYILHVDYDNTFLIRVKHIACGGLFQFVEVYSYGSIWVKENR